LYVIFITYFQLKARHRARAAHLAEKHAVEMAQTLNKQQQERDKFSEQIAKQVENDTLKDSVEVSRVSGV
jgi:folate-dependent phosphoribosylglycinamide formyltransferase PurN